MEDIFDISFDGNLNPINEDMIRKDARANVNVFGVDETEFPDDTDLKVSLNNVVAAFSVGCPLDLQHIGRNGVNVYYKRTNNMLTMRMRKPSISANIYATGRVNVTGASSLEEARIGSRRVARAIQKMGYDAQLCNYRITNILSSCFLPYDVRLVQFARKFKEIARFEPEINPGVIIKNAAFKTTLKIYSTGTLIINAHTLEDIRLTLLEIMPKIRQFRLARKPESEDSSIEEIDLDCDDEEDEAMVSVPVQGNLLEFQNNISSLPTSISLMQGSLLNLKKNITAAEHVLDMSSDHVPIADNIVDISKSNISSMHGSTLNFQIPLVIEENTFNIIESNNPSMYGSTLKTPHDNVLKTTQSSVFSVHDSTSSFEASAVAVDENVLDVISSCVPSTLNFETPLAIEENIVDMPQSHFEVLVPNEGEVLIIPQMDFDYYSENKNFNEVLNTFTFDDSHQISPVAEQTADSLFHSAEGIISEEDLIVGDTYDVYSTDEQQTTSSNISEASGTNQHQNSPSPLKPNILRRRIFSKQKSNTEAEDSDGL